MRACWCVCVCSLQKETSITKLVDMIKTTKIKMQWEGDYSVHARNSISGNPPETCTQAYV